MRGERIWLKSAKAKNMRSFTKCRGTSGHSVDQTIPNHLESIQSKPIFCDNLWHPPVEAEFWATSTSSNHQIPNSKASEKSCEFNTGPSAVVSGDPGDPGSGPFKLPAERRPSGSSLLVSGRRILRLFRCFLCSHRDTPKVYKAAVLGAQSGSRLRCLWHLGSKSAWYPLQPGKTNTWFWAPKSVAKSRAQKKPQLNK